MNIEHLSKLVIGSLTGYSRRHLIILETLAQSCQPSLDGGPLRQDRQKDRGKGGLLGDRCAQQAKRRLST